MTFEPTFTLKVKSSKKIFTTHFLIFRYKDLTINFVDFASRRENPLKNRLKGNAEVYTTDGHIEMEQIKLGEIQDDPRYTKKQHEEFRKRLDKLNDELKVRQESINLLKGRLKL